VTLVNENVPACLPANQYSNYLKTKLYRADGDVNVFINLSSSLEMQENYIMKVKFLSLLSGNENPSNSVYFSIIFLAKLTFQFRRNEDPSTSIKLAYRL
jgi:hypothetical protein